MSRILQLYSLAFAQGYGAAGEIKSNDQTSCLMVRDSWFRPGV